MVTDGLFSNQRNTSNFDNFNLSSANISLQWHIIQCTCIVRINTIRIGKILTVEINQSVLKSMFVSQFLSDLSKLGLKI